MENNVAHIASTIPLQNTAHDKTEEGTNDSHIPLINSPSNSSSSSTYTSTNVSQSSLPTISLQKRKACSDTNLSQSSDYDSSDTNIDQRSTPVLSNAPSRISTIAVISKLHSSDFEEYEELLYDNSHMVGHEIANKSDVSLHSKEFGSVLFADDISDHPSLNLSSTDFMEYKESIKQRSKKCLDSILKMMEICCERICNPNLSIIRENEKQTGFFACYRKIFSYQQTIGLLIIIISLCMMFVAVAINQWTYCKGEVLCNTYRTYNA